MNNISIPKTFGILLISGQGVSTMICISSLIPREGPSEVSL